jgi:hypothetical protein
MRELAARFGVVIGLTFVLATCAAGPEIQWRDTDGFSLADSETTDRDIALTFRYDGPCREASGDLTYAWRIAAGSFRILSSLGRSSRAIFPRSGVDMNGSSPTGCHVRPIGSTK